VPEQGSFGKTNVLGEIALLRRYTGWQSAGIPWTHIIPGDFGGSGFTDLLFYDSAGTGAFSPPMGKAGFLCLGRTPVGPVQPASLGRTSFRVSLVGAVLLIFCSTTVPARGHSTPPMGKAGFPCLGHTPVGSQPASLGRKSFRATLVAVPSPAGISLRRLGSRILSDATGWRGVDDAGGDGHLRPW
jgi:hypothetical protein